jgi:hypothetical protein
MSIIELAKETVMQRRRFVQLGMNGCLAVPLATSSVAGEVDVIAVLRGLMAEPLVAADIGRACLEGGLAEPLAVRAFVADLGAGAHGRQAIEDRFRQRRQSDFVHERLRSVQGWQLAESEVLAFAAVASS